MAELLIRNRAKPLTGDPLVDRHRSGIGCVIAVMPDGHPWSAAEKAGDPWMVVKLPRVSVAQLTQFVAPDLGYGNPEAEKLNRVLRRYAVAVDLAALAALLADPIKVAEITTTPTKVLTYALALKVDRPVLVDPGVIGGIAGPVKVIG